MDEIDGAQLTDYSSDDQDFRIAKPSKSSVADCCKDKPGPSKNNPSKTSKIASKLYECSTCNYSTTNSGGWVMHKKSAQHKLLNGFSATTVGAFQCPEHHCSFSGQKMDSLHLHLKAVHGRDLESESLQFLNENEFRSWKNDLQAQESCKFIKSSGMRGKYQIYYCHRSGHFSSTSRNIRELKKRGSVKCGKTCPARMRLESTEDGLKVQYCKTHIGHDIELGRVGLTSPQKRTLAAALKQGVPKLKVIQNVRSENLDKLTRISVVNNQDLINIEIKHGIGKEIKLHPSDAESINLKYNQLKESGDEGIFFYKPYGELSTQYPNLKSEDFVMAYMNIGQEHMLKTQGTNLICVDGTHGTNSYGFEMTTVLTLNDEFEGFPVVFFFHSSKSEDTYTCFFKALKDRVGTISTQTFMSDDEPAFFNAWSTVMGNPRRKLLCTWHVLRNWSKKLSCLSVDARTSLYDKLYAVLTELSQVDFEIASSNLIHEIENNAEYNKLFPYFSNYWKKKEEWSYSFRTHAGINTNMRLERMHKEIKYSYLKGKKTKRLDVGFNAVLDYLKNVQHGRLVTEYRGKLTSKDRYLRRAHKRSLLGDPDKIIACQDSWIIPSFTNTAFYTVKKGASNCYCETRCRKCQACIHSYICSCVENSIKCNMCKHIHLLCRYLADTNDDSHTNEHSSSDDDLMIHTNEFSERRHEEIMSHLLDLRPNGGLQLSSVDYNSVSANAAFQDVQNLAYDPADFKIIQDLLAKAKEEILARKNSIAPFPVSTQSMKEPANKNCEQQVRNFQKRKKAIRQKKRRRTDNAEIMKSLLPIRMQPDSTVTQDQSNIVSSHDIPAGEVIEISIADFFKTI